MDSDLKLKIQDAMISALRAQEKERLGTIRLIQAAIKQEEIDNRITLNDAQIISILDKMIRNRKDSIQHFEKANRMELVQKEMLEIEVIRNFLPEPLTPAEIDIIIKQAIKETDAKSIRDMGKVMGLLKPKLQGRADLNEIGLLIKNNLNQ